MIHATFEEQLHKIKRQSSVLENRHERAVELGAILPLLKQLGWDTEDMTQIYPQKPVPGTGPSEGKVDYDLQVAGVSRVFVEVKRWNHALTDEDETQLRDYCLTGKPSLAALTNGQQWRLYLPPSRTRRRGHDHELRQFLALNIIDDPEEVEQNFRQFLAREKMRTEFAVRKTVGAARKLFHEKQNNAAILKALSEAWNELATDEHALARVVTILAEIHDVHPDTKQVKQFIDAMGTSVNPVEIGKSKGQKQVQNHPKPESFTLAANGEAPIVEQAKHWNELLLRVCLLMQRRHPEDFPKEVLQMPKWFSEYKVSFKHSQPIANTGVYVKWGSSSDIKEVCPAIVSKFGYANESLTIQEK
jgi:predicted type IV restriction endonuclease